MLDGYTFSRLRQTNNFYCSKKNVGCKAAVKLNYDGTIRLYKNKHIHEKPFYVLGDNGKYIKCWACNDAKVYN